MSKQLSGAVLCPAVVGREAELTLIRELIDQEIAGQGQMVCLSGEAGIGKSRLITEARTYAAAHGALLLQGNCFATDQSLPYAPLLDLFREYFARLTPTAAREQRAPLIAELSGLLPDGALLFPETLSQPGALDGDPEQRKRRLFAVMTQFFTEQAAQCPVLVIVEDLHWCDDLSLEFLLRLARRCREAPILLLVTYRSDEVQPQLCHWLGRLDRERLAHDIALERLSHTEVAAMLRAILGSQNRADARQITLLDTLYTRSEGNPFYVEELLKSLVMAGALTSDDATQTPNPQAPEPAVPRSVQDAVQQRLSFLSEDARQLVSLAAVAGRRFNVTLLQEVMGCDEGRLTALLKELLAAQLVSEEEADRFAFRHALTHEAISTGLLKRERRALHREIAKTLERPASSDGHAESYLEALAYHCYEAGLWRQALFYSLEAAEKARALYAQRAVIDHLTHAEEAMKSLAQPIPAQLRLTRGQAYESLGDFTRAHSDYEQALALALAARQGAIEWQSLLAIGFLWSERDFAQAGGWFRRALALAETLGDPALHARSLNRMGNWLVNTGQCEEGIRAHHEAYAIFTSHGDTLGMAETLDLLGTAYGLFGDRINSVRYQGQAMALFRQLGDEQSLISILATRAIQSTTETNETLYHTLRTPEENMQDAAEALRLARKTGSLSGQVLAQIAQGQAYAQAGNLGQALTHMRAALDQATAIEHRQWMVVAAYCLGDINLALLQPAMARAVLESHLALARDLSSSLWLGVLTASYAQAFVMEHDLPQAQTLLTVILSEDQAARTLEERQAAWIWGMLALAQGKPERALKRANDLLGSVPGEQHQQPIPHLLLLKGEALLALSRLAEAEQALEQAAQGTELRHDQSLLWRIHCVRGRLFHRQKRHEDAQRAYHEAQHIITMLANSLDDATLHDHFLQAAQAFFPQGKPSAQRETDDATASPNNPGGLTAREREVAALVAQGCANREIAARLVVSERTAEAHVSNILGKLGFSTRAQIAVWAVEHGLDAS